MSETRAIAQGRGKWSAPGVPHRGWMCVGMEDLGRPVGTCEMCEAQLIRYAHQMEHPDFPGTLTVGCVCAGHMEGDLEGARARDRTLTLRAGRRRRWLTRKWRVSDRGNEWIKADGYHVVVYPRGSGWAATVREVEGDFERASTRYYATSDEVKLAAFDVISHHLAMAVDE